MSFLPEESREDKPNPVEPPPVRRCRHGVLLINLGTPKSPQTRCVRRYLSEFLSDPEVIHLPSGLGWLNRPLGRLIAQVRAPRSARMYRQIWTESGSPLGSITKEQATALGPMLPRGWAVFTAMRYGEPSIAQTLREIEAVGIEELVVVPMYPQFSGATTRTAVRELYNCLRRDSHHLSVTVRSSWHNDGGYIYAQAKLVQKYAQAHGLTPDNTHLVFSAHGLPVSYVERGDPYPAHIRESVRLVTQRLGWPAERMSLGFQSKLGPAKWLEPSLDGLLQGLAQDGQKRILVCPISFTVDCLETLEEIDLRYRKIVEAAGSDLFLCPALNAFDPFIAALRDIAVRGPRPITSRGDKVKPLLVSARTDERVHRDIEGLVMIGVSKANRIGSDGGPVLVHSSEAGLNRTKKPQCEVVGLLRDTCEAANIAGGMIWNTCHRFEFYGWLPEEARTGDRDGVITEVTRRLFADQDANGSRVNVLVGADARHHLMRTVCGLNSPLPGDKDILEQLATAQRIAQRAGTANAQTKQLINDAIRLESELRRETQWGRFDPGYCYAAMARVVEATGLNLADSRCAVFGGSTTSRSVLTALATRFSVPTRTLTLVYRGHGSGQMKLLRKAIGNGKRVRVQSYCERSALNVVANADVIILGVDTQQPVWDAEWIRDGRNYAQRPLTIIDFNTFGSTTGMETLEGVSVWSAKQLDAEVVAYGEAMCASQGFADAVLEAEEWIRQRQCAEDMLLSSRTGPACDRPSAPVRMV